MYFISFVKYNHKDSVQLVNLLGNFPLLHTEHQGWNCWIFKNVQYFPYWNPPKAKVSLLITLVITFNNFGTYDCT